MQKVCRDRVLFHGDGTPCVGVFDSGVGGLNVLAACMRLLPRCRYLYYGDNAQAPYGARPREEIARFVRRAARTLLQRGAQVLLLACNTATAACADELRAALPVPVIGMEPAALPAARRCRSVLILATPFTAESARLRALIARCPDCRFTVCALPSLAGEIERAVGQGTELTLSDHLPAGRYDGVVLGCTHYIFFAREIAEFYGAEVFDGAEGTAHRLAEVLGVQNAGTDDHLCPEQNPNKRFTKKYKKGEFEPPEFLGNGRKVNKSVFFRTFVL